MTFWLDVAAFALKSLTIVVAFGGLVAFAAFIAWRARGGEPAEPNLTIRSLDAHYDAMRDALNDHLLDKKARKALAKARAKDAKAEKAEPKRADRKRIYVLAFKGDLRATAVRMLATEIDAVLTVARPAIDEVILRVESAGGAVTGYGLAAAQLMRLRDRKVKVTACVDQVAASGGYLMACAADRIVAAPFAIVGSIGVVAQVPNLHRLLKRADVDYEEMTAGRFKRSVSMLGEITPQGREHFRSKLDDTHEAFKHFVAQCRPSLDIERVGDGDVWLGREALALGLVDAVSTSDDLLFSVRGEARLFEIAAERRASLLQRLIGGFGAAARAALEGVAARLSGAPK